MALVAAEKFPTSRREVLVKENKMFMSKARITGMTSCNWIVEVQEWPDGHWIGDTSGIAVLDKSHFIGNPKVGFEGTMTFDSLKLIFVVDQPSS